MKGVSQQASWSSKNLYMRFKACRAADTAQQHCFITGESGAELAIVKPKTQQRTTAKQLES